MTTAPTIIGIDLGKNWFHLIGLDARGAMVLRKELNRGQLAAYAATAPRGVVATEACPGSQYWVACLRRRAMRCGFCRRNS